MNKIALPCPNINAGKPNKSKNFNKQFSMFFHSVFQQYLCCSHDAV